jgi:hypothetical protein
MANNLLLAVAIADAARVNSGTPQKVSDAARTLTAHHPESDATVSDISAAIRDQRFGLLPRLSGPVPEIWFVD